MYGRCSPLSHPLRTAVTVRRGSLNVAILDLRYVHGRDWNVVAKRAGHHVADFVVDAILQQCSSDAMRGSTVHLSLHNRRIDDGTAIVNGNVVKNFRDA